MEKWSWLSEAIKSVGYTGKQVVTRFGLLDFEIFDLLKNGLHAYTDTGKKVVDSDLLPKGKSQSLAEIEANQRAKCNAVVIGSAGSVGRRRSEDEIKWQARRIYDRQPLEILNPPKDCFPFSFTLPDNDRMRLQAISTALGFKIKTKDLEEYERAQGLHHVGATDNQPGPNQDNKMQEARVRGGRAPKKNAAIMEAAKSFLLQNPKFQTASSAIIAKRFSKYNSRQPFEVTVDSTRYEIYCDGKKVYSSCANGKKGKYNDKSIECSTFEAKYISDAKKAVKSSKSNNT